MLTQYKKAEARTTRNVRFAALSAFSRRLAARPDGMRNVHRGALERHRQFALVLRDMPLTGSVLHFAPENSIAALLKRQRIQYFSADLNAPDVDLKLNIEKIDLPDEQYDAIVCSHVLEHVNDKVALLELRRILKRTGILFVMVPIVEGCQATYEDETITAPEARELHYGQSDHSRVYGADFVQRLTGAGFDIQVHTAFGKEALRYGLLMGDKVFICRKTEADLVARDR